MKRLIKHSSINLFHGTSSSAFKGMISDGKISANYNNGYSNNSSYLKKTYYLDNNNGIPLTIKDIINDESAKLDIELEDYIDSIYSEISDNINSDDTLNNKEKRQKIRNEYNSAIVNVYINEGNNEDDIVYLATESIAKEYAKQFLIEHDYVEFVEYKDNNNMDFGVVLEISVDEKKLGPDLNDSRIDNNSNTPEWKQTFDSIGQCVHYGDINIDQIINVTFIVPESMDENLYNNINFNIKYSLNEAINIINN